MKTGKTIALTLRTFVSKVISLLFNTLSGFVIVILPRSKYLLILWLQSCLALCDSMDCNTPGFLVLHHFPEFAQTLVHIVDDVIQPFHPLSSPYPLASIFPCIRVFSNESALHIRWPKYWSFSFNISPSNEY